MTHEIHYVLTKKEIVHYTKRNNLKKLICNCQQCQKVLKIGDRVVTKNSNRYTGRKIYHKKCYENMWIDLD